jgi:hypothetical protein
MAARFLLSSLCIFIFSFAYANEVVREQVDCIDSVEDSYHSEDEQTHPSPERRDSESHSLRTTFKSASGEASVSEGKRLKNGQLAHRFRTKLQMVRQTDGGLEKETSQWTTQFTFPDGSQKTLHMRSEELYSLVSGKRVLLQSFVNGQREPLRDEQEILLNDKVRLVTTTTKAPYLTSIPGQEGFFIVNKMKRTCRYQILD